MKKILFLFAVAGLCGNILACGKNQNNGPITDSLEDNSPNPIYLNEMQRVFVNENNAFTLKFLKTVNEESQSGNSFVYSPLSITYVLSMVNAAAEGNTERELETILGFHEGGIPAVNDFCQTLIQNLPSVDKQVKLHLANAIYVNQNEKLNPMFQKHMENYYDAVAESLDFASEESAQQINNWCSKKTNGMIPSIIDYTQENAVAYLLNAIYFKANWTNKFPESSTKTEPFTTSNGKVELPLMHQENKYRYMQNSTFAAVDIPYGNEMWRMTVMLPEKGKTTDDIINLLTIDGTEFLSEASPRTVDLKLPSFETESSTPDLIGTLKKLGITSVFGIGAEIPNMCDANVYISMMLQKARIKVNESGSEAAAVTVAVMEKFAISPLPPVKFYADRPFVYMIREASTGVILFVGLFTGK